MQHGPAALDDSLPDAGIDRDAGSRRAHPRVGRDDAIDLRPGLFMKVHRQ